MQLLFKFKGPLLKLEPNLFIIIIIMNSSTFILVI